MMKNIYKEKYNLLQSEFDCYDHICPYGILNVFQDVASRHANTFNMSFDDLFKNNKIWVLVKVRYDVISNIDRYKEITVSTWPKEKGLVDFDREVVIKDSKNNVLIKGISKWVILDYKTRKITPAKHINNYIEPPKSSIYLYDKNAFSKLYDFNIDKNKLTPFTYTIEFSDLDHNGHVNNAVYARLLTNTLKLKEKEQILTFEINYIHELFFNEKVDVYYIRNKKEINVKGINEDKTIFLAKIILK